ncbi:hypothetical protein AB0I84_20260, partial [Streptomyces spectabilis]
QSLKSVPYVRPVAHLKHLGGFGQTYHRREAELACRRSGRGHGRHRAQFRTPLYGTNRVRP